MKETLFKLNDLVTLDRDEDLEESLQYEVIDWNAVYKIILVKDFYGLSHYTLINNTSNKIIFFKEDTPYAFIDGEILSIEKNR